MIHSILDPELDQTEYKDYTIVWYESLKMTRVFCGFQDVWEKTTVTQINGLLLAKAYIDHIVKFL